MNWKDLRDVVGKAAPILGTLIGGPGGAAVGSIIASTLGVENKPDAVLQEIQANPEAAVKIREIEARRQVELESLAIEHSKAEILAKVQNATDVNATMREEAKSEHFLQFSWRPLIGYSVAFVLIGAAIAVLASYGAVILSLAKADLLTHIPDMLTAMSVVIGMAMPILGIASWHRGKEKVEQVVLRRNQPKQN